MKRFEVELRDLSGTGDGVYATCFYEGPNLVEIEDESGAILDLAKLSARDLEIVTRGLVLNVQADEWENNTLEIEQWLDVHGIARYP